MKYFGFGAAWSTTKNRCRIYNVDCKICGKTTKINKTYACVGVN